MNIRLATLSDAIKMHELHTHAIKITCKQCYSAKQIQAWLQNRTPEGYHRGILNKEMYIIEDNNKIIGFSHAVPGTIHAIFIDPSFHKQGAGKQLLEHSIYKAHQNNKKLILESTLNAEEFYTKCGFKKIKNGITVRNNVEIPIVIMEYLK